MLSVPPWLARSTWPSSATAITVHNGETLQQNVTMVEMSKKSPPAGGESISREGTVGTTSSSDIWKPVFIGTAVLDAGAATFALLEWKWSRDDAKNIKIPKLDETKCGTSDSSTGKSYESMDDAFSSACSHYEKRTIGWVVTGVVGAAVVGSFYMAFLRDRDHTETKTAHGGHKKRRELAVTPVITPDGGGATLRFDW